MNEQEMVNTLSFLKQYDVTLTGENVYNFAKAVTEEREENGANADYSTAITHISFEFADGDS